VKDYGYVGGFYGECSEKRIMRNLYQYGPLTVALNVPDRYTVTLRVCAGGASCVYACECACVRVCMFSADGVMELGDVSSVPSKQQQDTWESAGLSETKVVFHHTYTYARTYFHCRNLHVGISCNGCTPTSGSPLIRNRAVLVH